VTWFDVLVLVLALSVIAAVAVAVVFMGRSPSLLVARCRRRVLVTTKTDAAFAGVLYAVDREALVLRQAEALAYGAKKDNVPVEGELVVLRTEVAYLQALPAAVS